VMSETQRRNLERDVVAQRRELQRSTEEFREDVNLRRNEELGKFQRQIVEIINNLAKEEGFDLIVNDGAVVYASKQVDITDKVLSRLTSKK
jgi:outer membrane protein